MIRRRVEQDRRDPGHLARAGSPRRRVSEQLEAEGQRSAAAQPQRAAARATLPIEYLRDGSPRIDYVRARQIVSRCTRSPPSGGDGPQVPDLSSVTDPQVNLFTANEWNEAINGLWQLLDARWMNDPTRDDAASRKARQLRVAAEVGLKVPRTLITSDPERARRFVEESKRRRDGLQDLLVHPCDLAGDAAPAPEDMAHMDAVRVAPVIFQEFIPAESDLRITAVGGKLFPGRHPNRRRDRAGRLSDERGRRGFERRRSSRPT